MKILREKLKSKETRDMPQALEGFKRVFTKFGVYMILLGIAVLIALLPNVVTSKKQESPGITRRSRYAMDLKYILFWKAVQKKRAHKNVFRSDIAYPPGQSAFVSQNCAYINCYLTYNRSLLRAEQNFDAIVFSIQELKGLNVYDLNLGRYQYQNFIFKSMQSSQKYTICNPWLDNFFNWTWTYRLDSDIAQPFISIYDKKNKLVGPKNNITWPAAIENTNKRMIIIKRKTKAVAWFASSCNLKKKHNDFIIDLKKELSLYNKTVDVYGPCSENKKCGLEQNKEGCLKKIEEEYHFQLVLEDSITKDFVTERLVKVMKRDIVPIVLGKNFSSFIPPGSYINAGSFEMEKLGAIIDYLIQNPKQYSFFLDWKDHYRYETKPRSSGGICELCAKMNQKTITKSYVNFRHWWNKDYEEYCENQYLHLKFKKYE